jgi:peptidoglycan/LPS O-acetylase OafA/YrhL
MCLVVVPVAVLMLRCTSVWANDSFAVRMAATHLRLDALLFGVGIRAAAQYFPNQFAMLRNWRRSLVVVGMLLWLPNTFVDPATSFIRTMGLTWTFLGAGAFLVAAFHTHAADFRHASRIVRPCATVVGAIGVYSYAIYLWHVTALGILEREVGRRLVGLSGEPGQWDWLLAAFMISTGAVIVGIIAGRVVEWPVLRFRDRFFPSRSGSLCPHAGRLDAAASRPVRDERLAAAAR